MNHAALVRSSNPVLHELARVTEDLASRRRDLGFVRATEKRNWTTVYLREWSVSQNDSGSRRVADAEVATITAQRYEDEAEISALEVERDFLTALLSYDAG